MTETRLIGPVEIRVPSDPFLSRVVRLAASGLASMGGFTIDEIEDIKIAVSEVLIALIEHGDGQPVNVEFTVDDRSFEVRAHTAVENFDAAHPDLILCRTVLAEVCSSHDIYVLESHAHIWATVAHAPIE